MKKILSFFAVMMWAISSFSTMAADYWVKFPGDFNGWDWNTEVQTTSEASYTVNNWNSSWSFKIQVWDGSDNKTYSLNNTSMNAKTDYYLVENENTAMKLNSSLAGKNITFYYRVSDKHLWIVASDPTPSKTDAPIAWSKSSDVILLGDSYTRPSISGTSGLTMTYKTSNPDVATVSNTGVITLKDRAGKTTITASSAETSAYNATSKTYELTVNTYFLVGDMDTSNRWKLGDTNYQMTRQADGSFSITLDMSSDKQFKIVKCVPNTTISNWGDLPGVYGSNNGTDGAEKITGNGTYTLKSGTGSKNFGVNSNLTNVTISVNNAATTMTTSSGPADPSPFTWKDGSNNIAANSTVTKAYGNSLSFSFSKPSDLTVTYGAYTDEAHTTEASTSDISINSSNGAITVNKAGTYYLLASSSAVTGKYNAASAAFQLVVSKGTFTPAWSNGVTSLRLSDSGNLSGKTWKTVTGVPTGVTVTYSVSPSGVVSINSATGAIISIDGVGTASVSATFAVGDNYNQPATLAPYTIKVDDASKTTLHYGSGSNWTDVQATVDPATNCAVWTISGWNKDWEFYFTGSNGSTYSPTTTTTLNSGSWSSEMTGSSYQQNFKLANSSNGKDVLITFADDTHSAKADWPAQSIALAGAFNDWDRTANQVFNVPNGTPVTFTVNNYSNSTGDSAGLKVVINGETWFGDKNKILDGTAYTINNSSGDNSGNMKVQSSDEGKNITFTITYNGSKPTISYVAVSPPEDESIQKAEVHRWSLANSWPEGQTYRMFYLSSKQNGSRVSPEWELLPQDDDEYLLDEFMVIPGGNFMVRVFKKTGSTISVEGDYALHSDTNHTSDNYWISKTSSNLPGALTQKKYLRQTTLKFVKDQAFSVWQMGHTIVSIRVKFTDSNKEAKLSYDFRKPSTYKDAPIKGIPFIALNGQDIVAMPIPGGHNYIYDIASQGAPTSAGYIGFTNGWLQFDDEGKALVYDDNQSYYTVTGKGVMNTQGNVDLAGKSMYNTIQPPRNPVWFFNPTTRKNFSSDKMTFKYKGHGADAGAVITNAMLVDPDDATKHGEIKEGVDFALYEIRDVDMSGNYKIWTGHGSYTYGNTYNGLSFNTNWGVNTDSNIYGAEEVQSKYYRPMTGSGAYEELESSTGIQKTTRPNGQLWTGGNDSNYTFEDNDVGKYFKWKLAEGATSTYVSNLQFYYALEGDYPVSTDHNSAKGALGSTHNVSGYDNDLPGNTGRNYSWLFCNYEGNSTMIELAKSGANTGVITYAVNPSHVEGAAPIKDYTVSLYYNATPDFDYDDDGTISTGNSIKEWSFTCDAENMPTFIESATESEGGLETGYYMAQIVANCDVNGKDTKYVSTSDIIRVVGLAGKPTLTAKQEIEVDPVTEFKTYTFNIKIQADIENVYKANKDVVGDEDWKKLKVKYVFPFRVYSGTGHNNNRHIWLNEYGYDPYDPEHPEITKEGAVDVSSTVGAQRYIDTTDTFNTDGDGFAIGKNDNPLYYYEFTGEEIGIIGGNYKAPALVIEDYVPGKNYEFYVIVSSESAVGTLLGRANESVEMPQAVFTGTAEIVGGTDYNYVAIKDGHFSLTDATLEGQTDALYKTRFSMQAYNRLTTRYNWICEKESTTPKYVELDMLTDANNIVELNKVPYFPDEDGNRCEQTYSFRTKVEFVRTADDAVGSPAMTDSEVSLDISALNSPRQDIKDTRSDSETWGPLVNGNVGASVADGVDQITIIEKVKEGYYGVVSVYNDALIAAKIAKPTAGLKAKLDMSKLKINHVNRDGYGTNFHKDTHLAKTHENSPFVAVPGNKLRRWDAKPSSEADLVAPDGFQYALKDLDASKVSKYFKDGNRGDAEYKRVATTPSEVAPFWAGQGTAAYDDLMHGYYTAEDHYQGAADTAMPAWDGGEMLTLNTFQQLAYTIEGGTQTNLKIDETALGKMKTWFETYYNANDYTLNGDAPTAEEYAQMCINAGYVLLRVGHVNHQAFYHPAGWAGLAELVGETAAENGSWKFDMTEYVPLEMDLQYEYPMLGDFSQYESSFGQKFSSYKAKRKAATSAKTAATPLINDIKAPSTGFLPFDGSTLDTNPIPTGVDNVNADSAANANGWLTVSYDSNSATVSVRSNDAVGRVDIISLSGSVVASRTANVTLVELNVAHLAPGAYIVSVNGRGAKKIII